VNNVKVSQNIGIVNALIRITIGLTVLSWCTAKMVKRPWRDSYLFLAICGAMKVAEGIVRFCPVTALFQEGQGSEILQKGKSIVEQSMEMFQKDNHTTEHNHPTADDFTERINTDLDQPLPYNPS
jgi:hypothetical protein